MCYHTNFTEIGQTVVDTVTVQFWIWFVKILIFQ